MKDYPKVMAVTINAWRDGTGINTLNSLFRCWRNDKICQIYTTSDLPNTSVCKTFFHISENLVLKSVFNRKIKTGEKVKNRSVNSTQEDVFYKNMKKRHSPFITLCRELVWLLGKWKTEELDFYIKRQKPDLLFLTLYPNIFMCRLQKYIVKKTNKPAVCYITDDNFSFKSVSKNPLSLLHRIVLRRYIKYLINYSENLLVISPKQKEEYDRIFKRDSVIITKGIDFENIVYEPKKLHSPLKMVYTGKLIIGRGESLAMIADALKRINAGKSLIEFDIYSQNTPTEDLRRRMMSGGAHFRGTVSQSEVLKIQDEADILVFAESLESKYKNSARLSFSTKITDYMKQGKCIFAVGSRDIAPIDYFIRNGCALVSSSKSEITDNLIKIAEDPSIIYDYGEKAFNSALKNHNKADMDKKFIKILTDSANNR